MKLQREEKSISLLQELHDLFEGERVDIKFKVNKQNYTVDFLLRPFFELFSFDTKTTRATYGIAIQVKVLRVHAKNVFNHTNEYFDSHDVEDIIRHSIDMDFNGDECYAHRFPDDGILNPRLPVSKKLLASKEYKEYKKRVLAMTERLNKEVP